MHIGQSSSHIHVEDVNTVLGCVFISKLAVGATTVLLAQASKQTPPAVSMQYHI